MPKERELGSEVVLDVTRLELYLIQVCTPALYQENTTGEFVKITKTPVTAVLLWKNGFRFIGRIDFSVSGKMVGLNVIVGTCSTEDETMCLEKLTQFSDEGNHQQ